MFLKTRSESRELKLYRSLNARGNLLPEDRQHYYNLEKGYEGELEFDRYLESLSDDWLIVNDLFLRYNNTNFQIDSLLFSHEIIFLFEIKNFEGDFCIESDQWYTLSKKEINNPMIQLERNQSLLRRLLQDWGYNYSIQANLVFVNREFTLYNAPLDKPIILPSQINRYFNRLNMKKPRINSRDKKVAELLIAEHISNPPFSKIPDYNLNSLEKGIVCGNCHRLMPDIKATKLVCRHCGHTEPVSSGILRSVEEMGMLFPEHKITTNNVHDWCKMIDSKKRIQRVLSKNFEHKGFGKYSYYEPANQDGK